MTASHTLGQPRKYADMTTEDFDRHLRDIISELTPAEWLSISGIYEIVSEHFNNDVLDSWVSEQELSAEW